MAQLRYGDRVMIENLGIEGEVIEVDTRSVVVRYKKADGELVEHRFRPDDLQYIPKPQLE
jgi:preprotein translocase subunit YajC